ncbi:MAG: hypothetical protein NT027_07675 [Proteobacteria bacterium]|nr:hypothetical protein [Pseudomonadota bacterium]
MKRNIFGTLAICMFATNALSDIINIPAGGSIFLGDNKITCDASQTDIPPLRLGTYSASGCTSSVFTVTFASSKALLLETDNGTEIPYSCAGKSCYFQKDGQNHLIVQIVDRTTFKKVVANNQWCQYRLQKN